MGLLLLRTWCLSVLVCSMWLVSVFVFFSWDMLELRVVASWLLLKCGVVFESEVCKRGRGKGE